MASALIIFGSTGGNTELVTDKVAEVLGKKHKVTVQRVENSSVKDLNGYDVYILGCPTYGHGQLQEDMVPFHADLLKTNLKNKKFAIIALGDNLYDKYYTLEAGAILTKAVEERSGDIISPPLYIHKSPVPHLNDRITEWAEDLSKLI